MTSIQGFLFRQLMRWNAPDLKHDRPIADIRRELDDASKNSKPPEGTQKSFTEINGIGAEWITPPNVTSNGVLLYLHGGAYIAGSLRSHSNMVAYFANVIGARALLIDYRLAPEHPFPAAMEDAVAAYCSLLEQGIKGEQIIIGGDSAGGGLTLATLVKLRDDKIPLPTAAFCISPWTDLAATGASLKTHDRKDPWLRGESVAPGGKYYCGESYLPTHPLISPLYADLSGLPPVLIHVGDHEILLDDSVRVAEKMRAAGGKVELEVWKGMWHVFHAFADLMPESKSAVQKIGQFARQHLQPS
jgi:epsilon-lactone hydrolase